MSIKSLNSSEVTKAYGPVGRVVAKEMHQLLVKNHLELKFSPLSKIFTIIGSSNLPVKDLQDIFDSKKYQSLKPCVMQETDSLGNRLVQLVKVESESVKGVLLPELNFEDFKWFINTESKKNTKEVTPSILISNIQHMGIDLNKKNCLEVNYEDNKFALAMQEAGAIVTSMELTVDGLWSNSKNVQQFDIITSFLKGTIVNLQEFISTLKNLKKDGFVIISYKEAEIKYFSDYSAIQSFSIPNLMKEFFKRVELFEFSDCTMLKCSNPKKSNI